MREGRVCAREDDSGYLDDTVVGEGLFTTFTGHCLVFHACEYSTQMGTIGAQALMYRHCMITNESEKHDGHGTRKRD